MFKRIDHIALHVGDLEKSRDFYQRNFGFEHYFEHVGGGGQRIAYLRLGGTVLELTHRSEGAMVGFHFCLEAEDFDAAVAMLEKMASRRCARPIQSRPGSPARTAGGAWCSGAPTASTSKSGARIRTHGPK